MRRRHPWLFSGAIDSVPDIESGQVIRVVDASNHFVAWGFYNVASKIRVRVLDWEETAVIDSDWWRGRLRRSIEARAVHPLLRDATAMRLVFSEADGIPGLVVDRYGDFLVTQFLTAGVERVRPLIIELLQDLCAPRGIYDRSDTDSRILEGLAATAGTVAGEEPPELVQFADGSQHFAVDVRNGHKTGFYLDQQQNRRTIASYATEKDTLDLFSYTGAFAVALLAGGARRATCVESSAEALSLCNRNLELNQISPERVELVEDNVFDTVRRYRDSDRRFDLIVCDPPKFASSKTQLAGAERAYKDVNLQAMKILVPGGLLATFSCSAAVGAEHFARIVAWASIDAKRDVQILERLQQSPDHPSNPCFPESEYLQGLVCRVL